MDVFFLTDVNECEQGKSLCHYTALCINTLGSYVCQHKPGRNYKKCLITATIMIITSKEQGFSQEVLSI